MIVGMQQIGRRLAAGILAVFLSLSIAAEERDWNCPPTPGLPDGSLEWEKWFVGSIGGVGARMHLIGGGDVAKGEFYRQSDWKPVIVGGRALADGTLLLHDEQQFSDKDEWAGIGKLRARLTAAGLTGTWKASPGGQPETMRMRFEPAPKCADAGAKRAFRDRAWPITFEYPAAWHVDAHMDTITLLCPDPDWMAHSDWNVTLKKGDMPPGGDSPDETEFTRDVAGKWQYEYYFAGGPQPAHVEQRDGLTIIHAIDTSERGYCRVGGYSGLEDDEDVLIVSGSHWVLVHGGAPVMEIVDLVVKSATLRK